MNSEFKVESENREIIINILNRLQSRCSERLLSYEDLELSTKIAESILENLVAKQKWNNISAMVTPDYETFSPLYRGTPQHTQCVIRRKNGVWFVSEFERTKAFRDGSFKVTIDRDSLRVKKDQIFDFVTENLSSNHVTK
ncbi:hypothetical protein Q4489_03775 [Thalassotalea sp. 1_MG-2023]|uniref:hypothetical protein n=1 Tax=Thalassotalea sp. 1_MG-2023 TaxID=3062680 RepID=UPI0026E3477D|nr:hypothetical protein [Thalassotalea sp. 1_MG-2023]MDO6426114.1 hypothetical protein [Thalassotalea sp. 1_MG-2023]